MRERIILGPLSKSAVDSTWPILFTAAWSIGIHEFSVGGSCHRQDRLRTSSDNGILALRRGVLCHGTLTCKSVARALAGDKSKVWNAPGRISVYLWRGAIQWYTFPVARNSQYFHQKHTYNSRLRWQTARPTVLYESSERIWQRDAPSQLLPFIRALHYSVTESSVTS